MFPAGVALGACGADSFADPPDSGTPDSGVDTSTTPDGAAIDAGPDITAEAEAGPPIPTGKLLAVFQSRGDGNSDFSPFGSGDVAPPVAFDAAGNAYFAGSFSGTTTFGDPNKTTCNLTAKGGANDFDAYIVRIDPQGNCTAAARIGGASTFDSVRALAITPGGLVIAFGELKTGGGAGQIGWSVNGGADTLTTNGAFLVGLQASTLSFSFAQDMLPQNNATEPRAVAFGPGGTIAVSGSVPFLTSYQFMNSGGVVTSNGNSLGYQGFVAEYQQNGQLSFARVWTVKTPTGTCISSGGGVGYAPNGDLIVTGRALGIDNCDFLADSASLGSNPPADWKTGKIAVDGGTQTSTSYLVLRYDPKNAGALKSVFTKPFAGYGSARGATVAANGHVYALEGYGSTVGLKFGTTDIPAGNGTLLLHLDGNLAEQNARLLADTDTSSVLVDPFGSVVVGGTNNANIDFGSGKTSTFLGGTYDVFAAKFDPSLATCLWLNPYATTGREHGLGLAIASDGTIAIHGAFQGPTMPLSGSITLANKIATNTTYDGFGAFLAP